MTEEYALVINNAWSDDGHIITSGNKTDVMNAWRKWITGDLNTDEKLIAKMNGPKIHIIQYVDGVRKSRTTTSLSGLPWFAQRTLRSH